MSTLYQSSKDVPTGVLSARLGQLSDVVSSNRERIDAEFTMRIPAEVDRDADLVMSEAADRLESLQAECEKLRKDLVESEARGAALSAGACHGGYGDEYGHHRCHYQNRIDHLLALLRHAHPIIKAHVGASHMLDGFRSKRNQWDELVEAIDAAIQENTQ